MLTVAVTDPAEANRVLPVRPDPSGQVAHRFAVPALL